REDVRTTYRYGIGSVMVDRLSAISTFVGPQAVRRYQLTYHLSLVTRRSLLEKITLCAGAGCGAGNLPPTTFAYQESDGLNFDFWHVQVPGVNNGAPLGQEWRTPVIGDLDGDGTRDVALASDCAGRHVKLTLCPAPVWSASSSF